MPCNAAGDINIIFAYILKSDKRY